MEAIVEPSLRERIVRMANVVRRILGVPDYERYLAHQRRCHPDEPALTRDAFHHDALVRRHSQPGNRCC